MLKQPIYILSNASISALGVDKETVWNNYIQAKPLFENINSQGIDYPVSKIPPHLELLLEEVKNSDSKYKHVDRSVIMALFASRLAIAKLNEKPKDLGINFGSSRGATELFEKYFDEFNTTGQVSTFTSPATTLGNISSWVSHDLQTVGPEISHSITCSTGLHAVLNGIAWLQAEMSDCFLVGASEAPLTPFTLAQLTALKVYSKYQDDYPNKTLDFAKKQNTLVLGEAASAFVLSKNKSNAIAKIKGIGYATEVLSSGTSISTDALCFQKSMQMAIGSANPSTIDAIIMHAPGTIQGDITEMEAIKKVFGAQLPLLTSNKWLVGHTFATSGLLSMEMALQMLEHQHFISSPFYKQEMLQPLQRVLINAVGFGGNAVSVIVELV